MLNLSVPDIELPVIGSKIFQLYDAPKPLALCFYPNNCAPSYTTETQKFRALYAQFSRFSNKIYDISRDSLRSHENFKAKHGMPFTLLSESEEAAYTLFDVIKMKNMFGKRRRSTERSTFVIGRTSSTICRKWRKVKVTWHAEKVRAFVGSL